MAEINVCLQDSNTIDTTPVALPSDKDIPGREGGGTTHAVAMIVPSTTQARASLRAARAAGVAVSGEEEGSIGRVMRDWEHQRRSLLRELQMEFSIYTRRGEIWSAHVPGSRALSGGEHGAPTPSSV